MVWVEFTGDHEHREAHGQTSIDYKAGMRVNAPRHIADGAKAAGKANTIEAPPREHHEQLAMDPHFRPASPAQPTAPTPPAEPKA